MPFRMFDFSQLFIFNGVQEGVAVSELLECESRNVDCGMFLLQNYKKSLRQ
jgi:hypothetical protein